jgi:hypothetical protein
MLSFAVQRIKLQTNDSLYAPHVGTICQDSRLDVCYADYKYGTGASPLTGVFSKTTCCCSTIGKAWGSVGKSERCPEHTNPTFADLCPKVRTIHQVKEFSTTTYKLLTYC